MRIALTILLIPTLGCQREAATPAARPTNNTVATTSKSADPPSDMTATSGVTELVAEDEADEVPEVHAQNIDPQPAKPPTLTSRRAEFDLHIVDENGDPIPQATVEPISLSINYAKFASDENGHANIPWTIQTVKWVEVSKSGYVASGHIDVDQPKPITIILKRASD